MASFGNDHGIDNQHIGQGAPNFVPANWDGEKVVDTITTRSHLQSMPDKGNFGSVMTPPPEKPIVLERAAFSQGINAKYAPAIGEMEVMPCLVSTGPHAVGHKVEGSQEAAPESFRKPDAP